MPALLPTRISVAPNESLDSFLERLAAANDLRPAQILRLLRTPGAAEQPRLSFFMVKPDPTLISAIASVSGVAIATLENATLSRFGSGLPLRFDGFEPRERHSYHNAVAQGWFPTTGSQICSQCLSERGFWRIEWRLPLVAVCIRHGTFLTATCAGCGRRFRSHHYSPLRSIIGPDHPCGNPVGLRDPCRHSVLDHAPQPAPKALVDSAVVVARALNAQPVRMLGDDVDPRTYLAELRHLATLLLHMGSRPLAPGHVTWADDLRAEAQSRSTKLRGPRWGYSPPQSSGVRSQVLDAAHRILTEPSLQSAGARLAPWTAGISDETNGPSAWMVNRTRRSAVMEQLIRAAVSERHHVGRRLSNLHPGNQPVPTSSVPQLFDEDLFRRIFGGLLGGYDWTGRLYVSLCVVKAVSVNASWSDAAQRLGLVPEVGPATARAASKLMQVSPEQFAQAVRLGVQVLPRDRNFREREDRVRTLAQQGDLWHPKWCSSSKPARRSVTLPYAITWMWCEVCQGCFSTSPAWRAQPSRHVKAAYVAFRGRLPPPLQVSLRSLVLKTSSG